MSSTSEAIHAQQGSAEESTGRRSLGMLAGLAGIAGASLVTAVVASGSSLPSVVAGMNLGNHNETILLPTRPVELARK